MLRRFPRRLARSLMVFNASTIAAVAVSAGSALVLVGSATPAQAQQATSPISVQTAVVLDFDVAPGLDPVLGRKAADAIAVELKSSGDYTVTERARVEELVDTIPGLRAPYTPSTARRLGEAAGANIVITGRISSASTVSAIGGVRTARVQFEVRQMDVRTGDFVNGAQPSEVTIDQFQELDDDVLMDQSLDKAAYSSVRQMRLYVPLEATVTHNIANDVQLNRGLRDGVRAGQHYSVLRDHYNPARRIVERIKIAEIQITRVDTYQCNAIIVDGGSVGVHTDDKARRIYASGIPYTEPVTQQRVLKKKRRNGRS